MSEFLLNVGLYLSSVGVILCSIALADAANPRPYALPCACCLALFAGILLWLKRTRG